MNQEPTNTLDALLYSWWVKNKKPTLSMIIKNKKLRASMPFGCWIKKQQLIPKFVREELLPIVKKELDTSSILKDITKGISISSLSVKYNIGEKEIHDCVAKFIIEGFNIKQSNDFFKLDKSIVPSENVYRKTWNGEKVFKFGVCGDNQLCSIYQQLTFLNFLYDKFEQEGITTVYNSGDVAEGNYANRAGHYYELIPGKIGVDDQAKYIIDVYPKRPGIVTEFITGNHDHTHIKNGGANIGKMIAKERPDMKYLGGSNAVVYLTPNCSIELSHPEDGSSYALSYSIQKYIDAMSGGQKPSILLTGHYHKAMYLFYRNIHAIQTATTCAQTHFMRSHKLAAHVGGWIIEVHVNDEGEITRFIQEFIPQYTSIPNDY